MSRPRVHWVLVHPTHYHRYFLEALAPEVDLQVHYLREVLDAYPWKSRAESAFRARVFEPAFGLDWHVLRRALDEPESFFVVGGWQDPSTIALLGTLAAAGRRFAPWTDVPDLSRRRGAVKARLRSAWLRWLFARAEGVMGTGARALERLERMGAPREKLIDLPFFVDLEAFPFRQRTPPRDGEPLVFLSSGRLVNSHKGFDTGLRALAEVARRRPSLELRWRIAGTGPDEGALRELAARLGLDASLELLGWLEATQLPDFYGSGHVFLHPSHHDPFPNAVLEAMASGLPVIGSELAGSVVDRVEPGKSGMIHRAGDVEDLARCIEWMLDELGRLPEMSRSARSTSERWPVRRGVETIKHLVGVAEPSRVGLRA